MPWVTLKLFSIIWYALAKYLSIITNWYTVFNLWASRFLGYSSNYFYVFIPWTWRKTIWQQNAKLKILLTNIQCRVFPYLHTKTSHHLRPPSWMSMWDGDLLRILLGRKPLIVLLPVVFCQYGRRWQLFVLWWRWNMWEKCQWIWRRRWNLCFSTNRLDHVTFFLWSLCFVAFFLA